MIWFRTVCIPLLGLACLNSTHSQSSSSVNQSADEATTRALVKHATETADTYQRAIETFYNDANCYPAYTTETTHMTRVSGAPAGTPSFQNFKMPQHPFTMDGQYPNMGSLTTPVSYLTHLLPDPFSPGASRPFAYFGDCHGYLVWTTGPDGKFDIDWTKYDTSVPPTEAFKTQYTYDPTNGVVSSGDIWRGNGGR